MRRPPCRLALLAAALAAALAALGPARAAEGPAAGTLSFDLALRKAELEIRAGDLEDARKTLLSAVRLNPWSEAALEALERVEVDLYEASLADAGRAFEAGAKREAIEILRKAALLRPPPEGPVEAIRLLERHGYRAYAGEWVHEDDALRREKREARLAEIRRKELPRGEALRLYRHEDLRVWSDLPSARFGAAARKIQRLLAELRSVYSDLFLPIAPAPGASSGGLDAVVFAEASAYEEVAGAAGTAGIFLPRHRASFFFLGEREFEALVPTILHEVSHQLDDRILGLRFPPPWLQEGIAVLFEGAVVGSGGEIEEVGGLRPRDRARVREAASSESRWLGAERLVRTAELGPPYEGAARLDFYSQCGFLVKFLIDDPVFGRELFYRLVEKARAPGAGPEHAWRDFEEALRARGESLPEFETRLRSAAEEL